MRKVNKKIGLGLFLGALAFLTIYAFSPFKTNAQTAQSITITPPTIKYNLQPGQTAEGTLAVTNNSDNDLSFTISVFDFVVVDNQGVPQILPPGVLQNNRYSARDWIAVAPDSFTVKAHDRFNFNYYIKVPANAGPGGHYAAIVYQPVSKANLQGSGAAINSQIATLVYFDIAGDIKEAASVKQFTAPKFQEYGPVKITTEIKNEGDLHITPNGQITIQNIFGKTVAVIPLDQRNIFPGGIALLYENSFGQKLMMGKYKATFSATYGRNGSLPLIATMYFWVVPWKILTATTLAIIAIILAIILLKRRNQTPSEEAKTEEKVE